LLSSNYNAPESFSWTTGGPINVYMITILSLKTFQQSSFPNCFFLSLALKKTTSNHISKNQTLSARTLVSKGTISLHNLKPQFTTTLIRKQEKTINPRPPNQINESNISKIPLHFIKQSIPHSPKPPITVLHRITLSL
jgi:hypothetical protein